MAGFMSVTSLRGIGMMVLQALRVCTVITLFTNGAACWILIINIDKHKPYFVFQCISLFFTSLFCSLLVVSELAFADFIKIYLRRTWPVLSDHHGLGWLGGGMLVIGCNVLGTLNRPDDAAKKLSGPFASLVLSAGILSFVFGALNLVCALIWCDRKEGITSRDIRANGSLAQSQRDRVSDYVPDFAHSSRSHASSLRDEKTRSKFRSMFWKKDGGAPRRSTSGRPEISRPYLNHPHHQHHHNHHPQPHHENNYDVERNAGVDDRASPIIPTLKRPDTALHPIHTTRSSKYSEADMSRF